MVLEKAAERTRKRGSYQGKEDEKRETKNSETDAGLKLGTAKAEQQVCTCVW